MREKDLAHPSILAGSGIDTKRSAGRWPRIGNYLVARNELRPVCSAMRFSVLNVLDIAKFRVSTSGFLQIDLMERRAAYTQVPCGPPLSTHVLTGLAILEHAPNLSDRCLQERSSWKSGSR